MQQGQLIYLVRPLWPFFSHGFLQETRISQGQSNLEYQTHVTPFWPCSGYAAVWSFISNEPKLISRAFRGLFPRPVLLRTNYLKSGQERALCGDSEEKDRRSLAAGVHTYICCVWLERGENKVRVFYHLSSRHYDPQQNWGIWEFYSDLALQVLLEIFSSK